MGDTEYVPEDFPDDDDLLALLAALSDEELAEAVADLPPGVLAALLQQTTVADLAVVPVDPVGQAVALDEKFRLAPHIVYLGQRLAQALADVEAGISRRIVVSMPPRMGKTTIISLYAIVWILRKHPNWPIVLTSHDGNLATTWGRQVRRIIEQHPTLGVALAPDAGAASEWETTDGGGVVARGIRASLTGRGAAVMVLDDPHKDFVEAHSALSRQAVWEWWLTVAQTRLEPPSLVVVVATRWHTDDIIGRVLSSEFEGDPTEWEEIRFPAIAEDDDVLGRAPGDPLLSPLIPDETREEALARWDGVRRSVGSYAWAALYQQRPAPAKGAIFDASWWRYWTIDPGKATEDGRVIYLDPRELARDRSVRWLESWDCAFKGTDGSDYVVGQRWAKQGVRRILTAQQRARLTFTQTLAAMNTWANDPAWPVFERLVEDKANGTAVIDTLKTSVVGLIPVNPTTSKEARARAVTPEVEAGNVYLPHPTDPGNEWVNDALDELRSFPHAANDDVVDGLTQALWRMRSNQPGSITVPGSSSAPPIPARRPSAATPITTRRINRTMGGPHR